MPGAEDDFVTKALAAEENKENEETAYLKFVSQAVKESNSSNNKNSTTNTVQIPEAAKGPPIPAKGYLVQEILTICIGLQTVPTTLCS